MSALAAQHEAWLKAERKAKKRRQKMLDAYRQELRENGQMADHYQESKLVTQIKAVTETTAAAFDATTDAIQGLGGKKKKKSKAKKQLAAVGAHIEVQPHWDVESKPKSKKKLKWWQKLWMWIKNTVKKVFQFFVTIVVTIDGLVQHYLVTDKAAKRLYAIATAG